MKLVAIFIRALGVVGLVLLIGTSAVLAHGTPTISAQPATVAPGAKVTLRGDGLGANGDLVTISLRGMMFQAQLGTVKLEDDAFSATKFTIPANTPPGTYVIAGQNGSTTATASIEVTMSAGAAQGAVSAATTPASAPTAMPMATSVSMTNGNAMPTTATALSAGNEMPMAVVTPAPALTEATGATPVAANKAAAPTAVTTNVATQSAAANQANTSISTDQPQTMVMPGAVPVLTRVRTPIEWTLPIGFAVVAGGLGLFLLTRHLS